MKKLFLASICVVGIIGTMVSLSSCETDNGLTISFNQDNETVVTILPQSTLRIDTTANITSNLDSLLAANDASRDDIASITLAQVEVYLTDSLGNDDFNQNFNTWDSVGIRVFVPNDNSIPDVLVASSQVPLNLWGFALVLTQEDFDFLPYAAKQQFAVRLMNKLKTPLTTKKYIKVKVRVNIAANI